MIKEKKLRNCAAIASRKAAHIYGLEIRAPEIETNINNTGIQTERNQALEICFLC